MPYTIEEVLDHNIDWVNAVLIEILKQQMEDQLFQMALHGVSTKDRNKYRRENEATLKAQTKPKDVHISLSRFQNVGLSIGKENKTKVKR